MNRRVRVLLTATAAAVLLSIPTGSGWAKRKGDPPDVVSNAQAVATTDRDRAIGMLEDALAGRKVDKDSIIIMLHAGEQRRLNGDAVEANAWFTKVIRADSRSTEAVGARLGQAILSAMDGDSSVAVMGTLRESSDRDVLDTLNADRYLLLAIDAASANEANRVASHSKRALAYAQTDPELLGRIESTLQTLASTPPDQIDPTMAEGPGGTLGKAEEAYLAGDLEAARRFADKASRDNDPTIAEAAQGLLRNLDGAAPRSDRIAVILPLSDKYETVGNNIRDALLHGYRGSELQFYDSGSTPETAVAALEQAVLNDGAMAVIGPLLSDESEAMVAAAESLQVPLISLSQSYDPPEDAFWAFQAMYTRSDQITAVLDWSMDHLGMTSFAMFAPESDFGLEASAMFEGQVLERGGMITAQATYSSEEENLLPFVENLGEREGDLAARKREAIANGGNPDTVTLKPVIDFQALFLPESASRTPLACAALAYNEFPMGTFQPNKGEPEIPLIGLSTWNTEQLVRRGNQYTRNSIFPDVFSSTVASAEDPFILAFREATGRTPSSLEAAVVDAGALVYAATLERPTHRGAFREALLGAMVDGSITGAGAFDPETLRAQRNMMILTITRSSLAQVGEVTMYGAEPRWTPPETP